MEGTKSNPNRNPNPNPNPLNSGRSGNGGGVISPPFESLPSKIPPPAGGGGGGGGGEGKRRRRSLPNPRELVAHYESQGMEREAASLKVIEDLQNVLLKALASNSASKSDVNSNSNSNSNRQHLSMLEMKLESKPGYPQTLAIGMFSAGIVNAAANIWDSVRRSSSSSNPC